MFPHTRLSALGARSSRHRLLDWSTIARMVQGVRVMSCASAHHFFASGNTLVFIWQGNVSLASIHATRQCQREVSSAYPGGVRILAVIGSGTVLPSSEARLEAATIDKEFEHRVRAHATVLAGGGRWLAAARALLGAFFSLTRTAYPRRIFATVEDSLAWLAEFEGEWDRAALLDRINHDPRCQT